MKIFPFFLALVFPLFAQNGEGLMRDLMLVNFWDCYLSQKYPVTYNHLLQGGYINMPSARVGCEGELGMGWASVPPYNIYSLRAQLTSWLEATGNYRIFRGVNDQILSCYGFGDFSERGANLKVAIVKPEDSDYALPGFAVGIDDFMGTRSFNGEYLVMTKVHQNFNLEWSIGGGFNRFNGWFGAVNWMPFLSKPSPLQFLSLVAEFDATHYDNDPHPRGRDYKSRFNVGLKCRFMDHFDCSVSYIRGKRGGGLYFRLLQFWKYQGTPS